MPYLHFAADGTGSKERSCHPRLEAECLLRFQEAGSRGRHLAGPQVQSRSVFLWRWKLQHRVHGNLSQLSKLWAGLYSRSLAPAQIWAPPPSIRGREGQLVPGWCTLAQAPWCVVERPERTGDLVLSSWARADIPVR